MYDTAIYLGERLLSLLLPSLHFILSAFTSQVALAANLNYEIVCAVTARFLLSKLTLHLGHHLSYAVSEEAWNSAIQK